MSLDRHAGSLAAKRLADVAADLPPRDGGLQNQIVRGKDGRDELAAHRAKGTREADVEWPRSDATAHYCRRQVPSR